MRLHGDSGPRLNALLEFAVAESNRVRPGSRSVLLRIAELVFVEVLRSYLTTASEDGANWLGGLRGPVVGRALARMHAEPARAWTLPDLARDVGTSRSVLAERFASFVGHPPMLYLTRWRIQLAASRLASGATPVSAVASEVGYESEAAFSRAFKKVTGVTPPHGAVVEARIDGALNQTGGLTRSGYYEWVDRQLCSLPHGECNDQDSCDHARDRLPAGNGSRRRPVEESPEGRSSAGTRRQAEHGGRRADDAIRPSRSLRHLHAHLSVLREPGGGSRSRQGADDRRGTEDPRGARDRATRLRRARRALPATGRPQINMAPVPFRIVQTEKLVVLVYEAFNLWRQVHLDGREWADI